MGSGHNGAIGIEGKFSKKSGFVGTMLFNMLMLSTLLVLTGVKGQDGARYLIGDRNLKMVSRSTAYASREDMEKSFAIERNRAGLDGKHMHFMVIDEPCFVSRFVADDYGTTIYIDKDFLNEGAMRHEMGHAKRFYEGHTKTGGSWRFEPKHLWECWKAGSYVLEREAEERRSNF